MRSRPYRKIFLAGLLHSVGGKFPKAEFHNLAFLFSKTMQPGLYDDFEPAPEGVFSPRLEKDSKGLVCDRVFVKGTEDFQLQEPDEPAFSNGIVESLMIHSFSRRMLKEDLRSIIAKEFPRYAVLLDLDCLGLTWGQKLSVPKP